MIIILVSTTKKKLINNGYKVDESDYYRFLATKENCRDIIIVRNGKSDDVVTLSVGQSCIYTTKRAILFSEGRL